MCMRFWQQSLWGLTKRVKPSSCRICFSTVWSRRSFPPKSIARKGVILVIPWKGLLFSVCVHGWPLSLLSSLTLLKSSKVAQWKRWASKWLSSDPHRSSPLWEHKYLLCCLSGLMKFRSAFCLGLLCLHHPGGRDETDRSEIIRKGFSSIPEKWCHGYQQRKGQSLAYLRTSVWHRFWDEVSFSKHIWVKKLIRTIMPNTKRFRHLWK